MTKEPFVPIEELAKHFTDETPQLELNLDDDL